MGGGPGDMVQMLILVSGPPGAGKSTLSKGLGRELNATVLDKDCVDDPFAGNERGDRYTRDIEPKCLAVLLNLARLNFECGHSVILDVPWTHILINSPEWIDRLKTCAADSGARLVVVECVIPEVALKERLRQRGLVRDQFRLTDEGWKKFKQTDRLDRRNPLPHGVIDMREPADVCLRHALAYVQKETS